MKKSIFTLVLALCASVLSAVSYTDVVITPTANTLAQNTSMGLLLPADFIDAVFDAEGNPTKDKIILLLTMPSDFTTISIDNKEIGETIIDGIDIEAEGDYLFEFNADAGNHRYVLATYPFDPKEHAMEQIYIEDGQTLNLYITGKLTGADKLVNAELPERIKMVLPESLEIYRPVFNELIINTVKDRLSQITQMGLGEKLGAVPIRENTDGFFQFEGGESSVLNLYIEDFNIKVKDKKIDFIGNLLCSQLSVNFMGAESLVEMSIKMAVIDAINTELEESDPDAWAEIEEVALEVYESKRQEYIDTYHPADDEVEELVDAQYYMDAFLPVIQEKQPELYAEKLAEINSPEAKFEMLKEVIGYLAEEQLESGIGSLIPKDGTLSGTSLVLGLGMMFNEIIQGTASPFAFSSLSERIEDESFQVNIHSKGENTIVGGAKSSFENVNMFGYETRLTELQELCDIFEDMVNFTSAPLAVRPSAKVGDDYDYTCTRLTFDDVWTDGTHTNGLLQLPVDGNDKDAPSIDIGNPNGQVIFNGGRYKFHTPVSNKLKNMFYVATMAICYRELTVNMPAAGEDEEGNSIMIHNEICYSGIGTSVGWGRSANKQDKYQNVIINDGTFETYSAEAWTTLGGINSVDAVTNGWYKAYTDLRLPYNTSVYGGSFTNCDVYRCDAAAEQGVAPVYIINLTDITPLCIRKPYGAATLDADYVYNAAAPQPIVVDAEKEADLLFDVNGTSEKWNYGHQSLTPATDGFVYLYVPEGDCSAETKYMRNYTTALAPLGENHLSTDMITMGGDVEVENRYQNLYDQTNAYLLYTMLGRYTREYAYVEFVGGIHRTIQKEFEDMDKTNIHKNYTDNSDKRGLIFSDVTNEGQYRIEYGIYMMMPIMSDEWILFSPPYDVANIYIMETTSEQPKAPKGGHTAGSEGWTEDDYDEFYKRQGEADGNMAQILVTSVLPDIFSGKGSGVLKPLPDILNNMTNEETKLTKLNHWNGSVDANGYPTIESLMNANYYLNILLSEEREKNVWALEKKEDLYGNKWAPAPATSTPTFILEQDEDCDLEEYPNGCPDIVYNYIKQDGTPQDKQTCIMKRDSVYSMYFPGGANRWYDHKYLIIEGYGPQKLSGSNKQDDFVSSSALNTMTLQGNNTFATYYVAGADAEHPYFIAEKQVEGVYNTADPAAGTKPYYGFTKTTDATRKILPSQVYMVSSINESVKAMPALKNEATDMGNVPTIADEAVRVWTDNGIYISAIISQHISVYTLDGRTLWSGEVSEGTTQFVPADRGMYVVQGETTAVKVVN